MQKMFTYFAVMHPSSGPEVKTRDKEEGARQRGTPELTDYTVSSSVPLFARNSDGADQGTIVRRQPDVGFEALIPPIERGRIIKFRMNPKDSWRNLAPIQLPSAAPTTQAAMRE